LLTYIVTLAEIAKNIPHKNKIFKRWILADCGESFLKDSLIFWGIFAMSASVKIDVNKRLKK
jgi:hypothetical protein